SLRCHLQVLTVAATEPLNLLRSVPPRPAATDEAGETLAGGGHPATPRFSPRPDVPEGFAVDFQKVYEYLAQLCRGAKGPALPPGESAVVLALLSSLPPELSALDRVALRSHFRGVYGALTAPRFPETDPPSTPSQPGTPESGWRGIGLCPLNLFLVPLRLLGRAEASGGTGTPSPRGGTPRPRAGGEAQFPVPDRVISGSR
ncbi:snRNA-activating protein complex subunit 2, partial [Balearica regulorum gibbericeps]|uniref:snRNA-activating protein complex subunit 2 n=1 Tax=Balearica regulorum gibbericeps TaxID=100784 RepID=UPI003F62230C